jgi:tetratricopeptide (TPR) repeat protein
MKTKIDRRKAAIVALLICSFLTLGLPVRAQDLVPVSDITGGASVFVFKASRKAALRPVVSNIKPNRSKTQRVETARKVTKQFTVIAKAAPRRVRSKTVDPTNQPLPPGTMPKEQASKVFAGYGEYYSDKEDIERALEFFREAVTLDAKNKNAQMGLSEVLALKGNQLLVAEKAETARALFEESIKYNPKNAVAVYGLGEVLYDLGKEDEALASYEKALEYDKDLTEIYVPLGIIHYRKGEIAKADQYLTKAVAKSPEDAEAQYYFGLVRYTQNRNDEALAAFKKASSINKNDAENHYYAGKAFKRLNREKEALAELEEAVRLKPDYFEAIFDLGAINYELENYPAAVEHFKKATRLKNNNIEAFSNLGDAYRQVGNFNDAEASYNLALTFIAREKDYSREETAQIYSYAGYVIGRQCEINSRKFMACGWARAIKNFEKAAELSPNASDYTNLGWAYYNSAKTALNQKLEAEGKAGLANAKVALQKAIAMNPTFIEAPLLNLGVAQIDSGDYAGAVESLKKVTEKRPEWNFAVYALGVAYRKSGDIKNSAVVFRKAVANDPNYVAAWSGLGESEFRNEKPEETKKVIEKLKQLNAVGEARKLEVLMMGAKFKSSY